MRLSRLILAALVASALALAPVASALAAATSTIEAQAHAKSAMVDCHKPASHTPASKTGSGSGHCPDCGTKGSCSAACLLKCFQLAATLEPAIATFEIVRPHVPAAASAEPPGWSSRPPAPPPRA